MKKASWIFFIIIILAVPSKVEGQRWKLQRYELIFGAGTSHPFMDIGKQANDIKSFQLIATRPNATASMRFKILEPVSVGMDLSYIMFGGVEDPPGNFTIHKFRTSSFEHVATVQYSFVQGGRAFGTNALFNRRGMVNNYNSAEVYLFAGAGGILSKSRAFDISGSYDDDDPIHDNNWQYGVVFPMGIGMKYSIDAYWMFAVEIGGRFTLTDMLDGYNAQIPANNYNDRYILTSFRAIYKLRNDRRGRPKFSRYGR